MPSEPDLSKLFHDHEDKIWGFSRIGRDARISFYHVQTSDVLLEGAFGFLEPDPERCPILPVSEPDLILVPGIGFDPGNLARVGRGKGHYDRYLQSISSSEAQASIFGVCFSIQCTNLIPDSHDMPMSAIYTELGRAWVQCQPLRNPLSEFISANVRYRQRGAWLAVVTDHGRILLWNPPSIPSPCQSLIFLQLKSMAEIPSRVSGTEVWYQRQKDRKRAIYSCDSQWCHHTRRCRSDWPNARWIWVYWGSKGTPDDSGQPCACGNPETDGQVGTIWMTKLMQPLPPARGI